jgi:methenyltetrahydromethanopterin cyclohydrolase
MANTNGAPSLNDRAFALVSQIITAEDELGLRSQRIAGARVIDAGVSVAGTLEAGLMVARVCLADLGRASLHPGSVRGVPIPQVGVSVNHPLPACMAAQYAGWQIAQGEYFAMGSGPFRAAAAKEKLYEDIGLTESPKVAVGVLETSAMPPEDVVESIAKDCGVSPLSLSLIAARTASLVGGVQVVARSVETAMHKLHELGFDLTRVVGGYGSAPLPPVAGDDMAAIGRTNDAVLYGGQVTLLVTGDDESLAEVGPKLPSGASRDYGKPFAEVFAGYNYDFYQVDPLLFSPAAVCLQNLKTGKVHAFGKVNEEVLSRSFFD